MNNPSSPDAPVEAKARFWVGPLVAGCCFALGYGITERVLTLQPNAEEPVPEAFTPLAFPGDSLREIRARFSDDHSLVQVDVTAQEPELELDDSNIDSLALSEESIEVMPAVVVPEGDSPVLVAEPEPVELPPGAEAFFEVIEPVTPPQP